MIKYRQLLKGSGKTRKNLWYICGDEPALISDAIEVAKDHVYGGVSSSCVGIFNGSAGIDSVLDFINRPYYEERKIILVHDAYKLKSLESYIDLRDASTFYILVDHGTNMASEGFLDLLLNNSKVRAVDCSNPKLDDLKLLVVSRLNISDNALNSLLSRSNGDSEWLMNKVRILEQMAVEQITRKIVDLTCTDEGIAPFEDSLIQFDKRQCFLYIKSMGTENIDVNRIIDDAHNLSLLNVVAAEHSRQIRPITDKTGLTKKQVDQYINKVSYYDSATSKRCFNSLMRQYDKLRRGDRLAYISLVCGW
jgi:hypothetical protein